MDNGSSTHLTNGAQVITLLQRISDQLEALTKQTAAARHGSSLPRADRDRLAVLLPGVSAAIGSAVFTCRDAMEHADQDAVLKAVLSQVLGDLDAGSARRLGKLLARAECFEQDGLRVESVGDLRDGRLWKVTRV